MFSPFERKIAFRYLRARKAEGFVSVIAAFSFTGIMLGVATLIIVMSVMNGFRSELLGRIIGLNGHMNIYANGPVLGWQELQQRAQQVSNVKLVSPVIEQQVLLTARGATTGAMVRGMRIQDFAIKPVLGQSVILGELKNFDGNAVIIGAAMSDRLGIGIGDNIVLVSPKGKSSPFGTVPRSGTFKVAAIFDVGMYEYDSGFIFIPLDTAQTFFSMNDSVTGLEVFVSDPDNIDKTKMAMIRAMRDSAIVQDWRDSNTSFFNALKVERNVMFLILTLIILVAAFNIISSMIMLVKDKSKDIAIMRTFGAARSSMLKIFILTGASIGLAGTFIGAACGILFALNIETIRQWIQGLTGTELFSDEVYFLSQLPAEIEWPEVFLVIMMAMALSILATLYPAWRAARLDPSEALRYE